jgi:hypothetical protein
MFNPLVGPARETWTQNLALLHYGAVASMVKRLVCYDPVRCSGWPVPTDGRREGVRNLARLGEQ